MDIAFVGIFVLCVVLAVVLAAYDRLMRKYKAMKLTQEEIENRARDKAIKIIEEARDKAVLILNDAKLSAVNNQQDLDSKLSLVAEQQVDVYKDMLQKVSKNIEEEAVDEITEFRKVLENEVVGTEQNVSQKIEAEYAEVNKKIAEYKEEKLREFDKRAEMVVKEFVKTVLGKSLSEDIHMDLIKQALEEAKRNNVL